MDLNGANILVTGGTGSFGTRFVDRVLASAKPQRLIVYSRDELKQFQMRQQFPVERFPNLRMVIGDVRDRERLFQIVDGVDIIVHAAALKQVPAAEYNPLEAIKTNILGAANLIDAAIERRVSKIVALSTDKAANPVNLYGATKLCSDKLFVAANGTGMHQSRLSVVRYGNVTGSRGSVIPYFLAQRSTGRITVTDERMTRFLIGLDACVASVLQAIELMQGGEIFVPKMPSVRVLDLAQVIAPGCERETIGIRPGEKLHETLIPQDESHLTIEFDTYYVIQPSHSFWNQKDFLNGREGQSCPDGFRYSSDTNPWRLSERELKAIVAEAERDPSREVVPTPSEPHFIVGG